MTDVFLARLSKSPQDDPQAAALEWAKVFGNPVRWDDLSWLRPLTKLPMLLKGIQHPDDVRTVVGRIEAGSAADKAGLKEGDKIIKVRLSGGGFQTNGEVLRLSGKDETVAKAVDAIKEYGIIAERGCPRHRSRAHRIHN